MPGPTLASEDLLCSPRSRRPLHREDDCLRTADGSERFPIIDGLPILIDPDRSIVGERVLQGSSASAVERPARSSLGKFVKRLLSPVKPTTIENIEAFVTSLKARTPAPLVLVIGGGTEGQGTAALYRDSAIARISFDIYNSPGVSFVADAHSIPLRDASVDGVLIQAVLEHVLLPERVVDEVWRVLKPEGLVYSETPFLQQVHEGAYDFTRFTDSGHRYLFRRFDLVRSGPSGGAGTQLLWSLDYFARGLFRSRAAGKAIKLAFFWLAWLDRLIPDRYTVDTASGFYFLGRKSDREIGLGEIVRYYSGAMRS